MKTELIKLYKWLVYPMVVLAAAAILVVQTVVPDGVVSKLKEGWFELGEKRAAVERLKMRVATLEKVGEREVDDDLKKLFLIIPATKELLPVVSGLRVAAERSGVALEGYNAVGGEIKGGSGGQNLRVDVSVAGTWPAVIQFVRETERLLPVRKVIEVSYTAGKARAVVEGRWAPLLKVSDVGGKDVPDYRSSLGEALGAVAGYEMPSEASESGVVTGEINPSLF